MIPGHNTPEQYRAVCLRVVRDAQWLVIDRSWTNPLLLRAVYREFEAAMRPAFDHVVHESPVFELRRRGANATERSCGGSERRTRGTQPRVTCADTQRHRPPARHQMSV
jgi:hypothetical protein